MSSSERTPLVNDNNTTTTAATTMINNNSSSGQSEAEKKKARDDALHNLLTQIRNDPRYSEQAEAVGDPYTYSPSNSDSYSGGGAAPPNPNAAYIENTANADISAATNWDLTQCTSWTPTNYLGAPMGVVIWNPAPLKVDEPATICAFCSQGQRSTDDPLFKPCGCKVCHRSCFKQWRSGWINPTNYYQCRDCMHNYKIERIAPDTYESPQDVRRTIRCKIAQLWIAIILTIAITCSLIATIAWASDKSNKNVPIFVKSVMTSVVYGFPNSNSTKLWREEFKDPNVHVFQYYGLLGAFVTALIILVASCFTSTSDKERSGDNCCNQCYCGSRGGDDTCFWCCIWSNNTTNYGGGGRVGGGGCDCCDGCGNCDCGDCGSGGCSGGDCKLGNMGEAAAIIIIIIVVVVLISAIFVAVLFAVRKSAQLHDSVATMVRKQQEELENATVVFGMDEFVRPIDQV